MASPAFSELHGVFVRKERKIRSSCNACGIQKIRCGKQRPKCCRCTKMGLDCEYSMSMRTGERSRFPVSPAQSNDTESPKSADTPQSTVSTTLEQLGHLQQGLQQDIDWMFLDMPELHIPADQALYLENGMFDSFGTSVETDDPANSGARASSRSIPTPPIQDYDVGSIFHARQCYSGERYQTDSPSQPSTADSEMETPQQRKAHDCLMATLEIIADFHVLTQTCLTAANDGAYSRHSACSAEQSPKETSTVLAGGSGALQKLGSILDCRCFLRKEVQAMVYLAIDKIVCWYVAVLGDDGTSLEDQSVFGIPNNHMAKTSPVTGSYGADNEAQRLMSAHLVLEQLQEHVTPLMNRLRHCHSSTNQPPELTSMPWNIPVQQF